MTKREQLATLLRSTGVLRALEWLPAKPGIFVMNHHRIGDATAARFDREVFSATEDQLDMQLKYFRKHSNILTGEELEDLVARRKPLKHMHVYFTFDDGYLDNYTRALDVLRANDSTAAFFLVPSFVGSDFVPWWDEIAYLIRNTTRHEITLTIPTPIRIATNPDREAAIHTALQHYKRPDNHDPAAFLEELRRQADCELPHPHRRFLNWDEARTMQAAGMTIGSHTCTHPILGQLPHDQQRHELEQSKLEIERQLGRPVATLAYPVGSRTAFDATTQQIAQGLGYTTCFSFYGGINTLDHIHPTDLRRGSPVPDPLLFRAETIFLTKFGKIPY